MKAPLAPGSSSQQPARFAVAWRNTTSPLISPVGILDYDGQTFRFWYLAQAGDVPGFRPFIGFSNFDRVYESNELFTFFALRAMSRKRPDFPEYMSRLALPLTATDLDILSRSGGERKGDTVQLIRRPEVLVDGRTSATFLARGARYAHAMFNTLALIQGLREGEALGVLDEPSNPVNHRALLLTAGDGRPIAWVPDLLIDYVMSVRACGEADFRLLRNNGTEAPWHLRLLIRLQGRMPAQSRPFTGPAWEPKVVSASG